MKKIMLYRGEGEGGGTSRHATSQDESLTSVSLYMRGHERMLHEDECDRCSSGNEQAKLLKFRDPAATGDER